MAMLPIFGLGAKLADAADEVLLLRLNKPPVGEAAE